MSEGSEIGRISKPLLYHHHDRYNRYHHHQHRSVNTPDSSRIFRVQPIITTTTILNVKHRQSARLSDRSLRIGPLSVTITTPDGERQLIAVRVWNETVSNLTLMALGSSAPEILLSVIEIYAENFEAGDLGPGTIVGSAAFNLFVIIAICVWAVPSPEVRRIKHLRVFAVTMTWSVFAYIWLYAILTWSSWGVIEVWEGILTLLFFPVTVGTAYAADRGLFMDKFLQSRKYRLNKRGVIVGGEGSEDEDLKSETAESQKASLEVPAITIIQPPTSNGDVQSGDDREPEDELTEEAAAFEKHRKSYIEILRNIRRKYPDALMEEIEAMAREEILNKGPKSRAYYRIQATRKLMGAGQLMRRRPSRMVLEEIRDRKSRAFSKDEIELGLSRTGQDEPPTIKIYFDPGHITCMESCGELQAVVMRDAANVDSTVCVDYKTEDGTACAGTDYEHVEGTLIFRPGEREKIISITIIDDEVFEEDEHFYIRLSNPRYSQDPHEDDWPVVLETPSICTVMILDDDHCGYFTLAETDVSISEAIGEYKMIVNRNSGARGRVLLPYKTVADTAKPGTQYEHTEGTLIFEDNEITKTITVAIIDEERYEKNLCFSLQLGEPKTEQQILEKSEEKSAEHELSKEEQIALQGLPKLGEAINCVIHIRESKEFKSTVDKLFQKTQSSLLIGTSSWKDQFIEAFKVMADDEGDDDEEGDEEEIGSLVGSGIGGKSSGARSKDSLANLPTCSDYVFHFITVFWKFIFAFVPPTDYVGGWACFTVSILMIGVLTAFVGDLASHFGCTIGLADSVTAITFVALGTSIPDTFASKVAAINDKYADSSIGNVTGSNAVNVFLGIGIAWSLAALVHWKNGTTFRVHPGNLAYSLTLFCICAAVACVVLLLRRRPEVGGELGGAMRYKLPTTVLFASLWGFYVLMSTLEAYGIVKGF
ncbi:sodium/calcium exchanger 1-like isoform X2 [Varroa destructor]|uniref:Calx-beta domain-containing protein n=1 Tax=Varroa destructor TaxID=109461 RepID=A0A7M7JIJ0_VARDE|nr:sodium/calcium exchanger 1-like isoform X2 [Varroa destructor]XP_022646821.1 sodium/calcium exchanger 1-like isoform X2 [Varroa destructor]